LLEPDFFAVPPAAVRAWGDALRMTIQTDPTVVADLLARLEAAGEPLARARLLKRAAFAVFCDAAESVPDALPRLQTALFDALRGGMAATAQAMALLALRVVLVRAPAATIQPLWPAMMTELMRIFGAVAPDPPLLLQALKLLDFALLLFPSEMQAFRWIFMGEWVPGTPDTAPPFAPYADRVLGVGQASATRAGPGRPLITQRSAATLAQLQPLVDMLRARSAAAAAAAISAPYFVDTAFIVALLEQDFAEYVGGGSQDTGWVMLEGSTRE
jgi:hypothetical protein